MMDFGGKKLNWNENVQKIKNTDEQRKRDINGRNWGVL